MFWITNVVVMRGKEDESPGESSRIFVFWRTDICGALLHIKCLQSNLMTAPTLTKSFCIYALTVLQFSL